MYFTTANMYIYIYVCMIDGLYKLLSHPLQSLFQKVDPQKPKNAQGSWDGT